MPENKNRNKIDGFNFGWALESGPVAKWFYRSMILATIAFFVYTCGCSSVAGVDTDTDTDTDTDDDTDTDTDDDGDGDVLGGALVVPGDENDR